MPDSASASAASAGRVDFEVPHSRGQTELHAVSEDGDRPRQFDGLLGLACQPGQDAARHAFGTSALDLARSSGLRRDLVGHKGPGELDEEKRIAFADVVTGPREFRGDVSCKDAAKNRQRRLFAEAVGVEPFDARRVAQIGERSRAVRAQRSGADRHEDWEVVQTTLQVGKPGQRRFVGPVDVVDDQRERTLIREVRAQPVEGVDTGKIDAGSGPARGSVDAR